MADPLHLADARRYAAQIGVDLNTTLFPIGYGTELVTLETMAQRRDFDDKAIPEAARRFAVWLVHKRGLIGIGGGWRKTPSLVSQASRDGRSFHQDQLFDDGQTGYTALDLVQRNGTQVHKAPDWAEVPHERNMDDAWIFGVHCNIGYPGKRGSESWHMQPIEQDGYGSWVEAGSPAPDPAFVISAIDPPPLQPPPKDRIIMATLGPLTTSPTRLRDTRAEGSNKLGTPEGQTISVLGVNPTNFPDVAGITATVNAIQVEGEGYVTCNGTTVLNLDGPDTQPLNTFPAPLDDDGVMELVVYGAKCHLIVDRIGHHEAG